MEKPIGGSNIPLFLIPKTIVHTYKQAENEPKLVILVKELSEHIDKLTKASLKQIGIDYDKDVTVLLVTQLESLASLQSGINCNNWLLSDFQPDEIGWHFENLQAFTTYNISDRNVAFIPSFPVVVEEKVTRQLFLKTLRTYF